MCVVGVLLMVRLTAGIYPSSCTPGSCPPWAEPTRLRLQRKGSWRSSWKDAAVKRQRRRKKVCSLPTSLSSQSAVKSRPCNVGCQRLVDVAALPVTCLIWISSTVRPLSKEITMSQAYQNMCAGLYKVGCQQHHPFHPLSSEHKCETPLCLCVPYRRW